MATVPPPLPPSSPPAISNPARKVAILVLLLLLIGILLVIAAWMMRRGGVAVSGTENIASAGTAETPESGRNMHQLSMSLDFAPLETGAGNPMRVGSERKSIVYVIDKSSSMSQGNFERVRLSLVEAIEALSDDQKFAVVLFESIPRPLSRKLLEATSTNKQSVINQLFAEVPRGGTEPAEAVRFAMELSPEAIVLLSDGEFEDRVTTQIIKRNQSRIFPIVIHCIGVGQNVASLRRIARSSENGSYISVAISE